MIDPPYPKPAQKLVKRSFSESLRIRGLGISKIFCFLTEEAFTHPKNFLDRFYRQFCLIMSRTRRVLGLNSNSEADAMTHVFFRNNSEVRETLEITRNYKPLPLDTRVVIIQSSEFDVTHAYDLFCWEKTIQAECDCYTSMISRSFCKANVVARISMPGYTCATIKSRAEWRTIQYNTVE